MALSKFEQKAYLSREPQWDDIMCGADALGKSPAGMVKETREVVALARKFNDEMSKEGFLEMDRKIQENPDYLPEELVKKASEWGFYTMWIPKLFGGKGYNLPSFSHFAEELAANCAAMANLIGVHYLGMATLMATWNSRLIVRAMGEVIEGERTGRPCLISLALTEPSAGTDIEDVELMEKGEMTCHAERVPGGYRVNGSKVFISNGHLSTWHILFAFSDLKNPSENLVIMAVRTGMKGFSFGRVERKMGQKACPASELIFKDCHVPDDLVCMNPADMVKRARGRRGSAMQVIDYIFSASRAGVCAFGAGVARGAYEDALQFASETIVCGKRLIDHEWAQGMLARMRANTDAARLAYVESNHANSLHGMYKWLQFKPFFYFFKWLPPWFFKKCVRPFLTRPIGTWILRKIYCDFQTDAEMDRVSGWGSLAKCAGSDAAVANGRMALEMMGQAGLRHDASAEKRLRDAKLLQIYEGTNQLNRLNLFKCLIARSCPGARVFDD
ncbi:Acyl-CoA dehydrogenase [Candidatus Desulfarcum epimagneticum]|uniref:Acyl-CoA dehydrogenase n=1 Tax=uncultured Desulfobacteraceae bacterium TaxID=218296 RepID=A0A484HI56_9BACT|nr:Acyl-CoA dehydrogenase [uncultured Desulfobacteraceae bacterium]